MVLFYRLLHNIRTLSQSAASRPFEGQIDFEQNSLYILRFIYNLPFKNLGSVIFFMFFK